jgi:hypothetical protein
MLPTKDFVVLATRADFNPMVKECSVESPILLPAIWILSSTVFTMTYSSVITSDLRLTPEKKYLSMANTTWADNKMSRLADGRRME